jgi:hypothetical protein
MKIAAFTVAFLLGGAAFAQTDEFVLTAYEGDGIATTAWETEGLAISGAAATGSEMVAPSNSNPERDARGIAVISDPATVPAGWNGTAGSAMGGPEIDPVTGEPVAEQEIYPACTATVTDNCVQTYERGRKLG